MKAPLSAPSLTPSTAPTPVEKSASGFTVLPEATVDPWARKIVEAMNRASAEVAKQQAR